MATTYRRRVNFIGGLLTAQANGASAVAGTSVGLISDGFAALPTLGTDEYVAITIDPDGIDGAPHVMYLTTHTAGSVSATGVTGQEDTTPRSHDIDTTWVHAATLRDAPTARFARRTSGNITLNSTSWANVDTGLDIVLKAQAGDVIEATVNAWVGAENVVALFNVVTVVSGSALNGFAEAGAEAAAGEGMGGWYSRVDTSYGYTLTGVGHYTVVSGDIVSGLVTFRLRYKTATGTNRTLRASTSAAGAHPFEWCVKNLGSQGY